MHRRLRKTYQNKYLFQEVKRDTSTQIRKSKLIPSQENCPKHIHRLGLGGISKIYRGIKKYTIRYTLKEGELNEI